MSSADTDDQLQDLASRLQRDVPIHVPSRRYIRRWRPHRAGLFSTASMGLADAPPSSPVADDDLHPDKGRFLSEVREILDDFQGEEMAQLRQTVSAVRNGSMEMPFSGLHLQISNLLNGNRRVADSELPLRTDTGASYDNAIFNMIRLARSLQPQDNTGDHVVSRSNQTGNYRVFFLYHDTDLFAAYGRVSNGNGARHDFLLRGAVRSGSPVLSFANGLRSTSDQAEQFELLVVSLASDQ